MQGACLAQAATQEHVIPDEGPASKSSGVKCTLQLAIRPTRFSCVLQYVSAKV